VDASVILIVHSQSVQHARYKQCHANTAVYKIDVVSTAFVPFATKKHLSAPALTAGLFSAVSSTSKLTTFIA